jgi:hypothetical protein
MKVNQYGEDTDAKLNFIELVDGDLKFNTSKEVPLNNIDDIKNPNLDQINESTMDINSILWDDLEKGPGGDVISPENSPQS